jgi:hypothetical protein
MSLSTLSVYAVQSPTRYAMAKVSPPDRSFHLTVPPGFYEVVARLDSDPLSAAGDLSCTKIGCVPVMTRAGYVTCRSVDCQPDLVHLQVDGGRNVSGADVGGWGSLQAADLLWSLDEYGIPGPSSNGPPTSGVRPSPSQLPPLRPLPSLSSDDLPVAYGVPEEYDVQIVEARLHLPAGWRQVNNPGEATNPSFIRRDFTNENVRSPLALDAAGIWMTVSVGSCGSLVPDDATARAFVSSSRGSGIFYFEDPRSPVGQQPFSGYAFAGDGPLATGICTSFRFTASSDELREADLPVFLAIVARADFAR